MLQRKLSENKHKCIVNIDNGKYQWLDCYISIIIHYNINAVFKGNRPKLRAMLRIFDKLVCYKTT